MILNKYYSNFSDYFENEKLSPPCEGSKINSMCFSLSYIPDVAEKVKIGFDMISEKIYQSVNATDNSKKQLQKLSFALDALKPHLIEFKNHMNLIDAKLKLIPKNDYKRSEAFGKDSFLYSWLENRCNSCFQEIIKLPESKMASFAKSYKPTCTATFIDDIEFNANIIKLIPNTELTHEICIKAVMNSPSSIRYMKDAKLTTSEFKDIYTTAAYSVQNSDKNVLNFIPEEYRTDEIIKAILSKDGLSIQFIENKNPEFCILACLQTGLAWDCIPKELRTLDVEFCTALHGYHKRDCDCIFNDMLIGDPDQAQTLATRYEQAFIKMHMHKDTTAIELEDIGWSKEAAQKARC